MEYIVEDEFTNDEHIIHAIKKDKPLTLSVDKFNNSGPKFMTKEQRERIRAEEENKKEAEKKEKELEHKRKIKEFISKKYQDREQDKYIVQDKNITRKYVDKYHSKRSRSNSSDIKYNSKVGVATENLEDKEIEAIKNHYLGLNKEKRKLKKPSEKFKNIFNFEWDKEEDTSADIIYKNANEPHLLFGRGIRGGFDIKEQKKKTKEYEKMLKEERGEDVSEEEKNIKKRSKKSRSRSRNKNRSRSEENKK